MENPVRAFKPRLLALCKEGLIPYTESYIHKIAADLRPRTAELALEVHRATKGEIPCWVICPELWAEGQVPPCLSIPEAAA